MCRLILGATMLVVFNGCSYIFDFIEQKILESRTKEIEQKIETIAEAINNQKADEDFKVLATHYIRKQIGANYNEQGNKEKLLNKLEQRGILFSKDDLINYRAFFDLAKKNARRKALEERYRKIDKGLLPCFRTRKEELCDGDIINIIYNNDINIKTDVIVREQSFGRVNIQLSGVNMSQQAMLESFTMSRGYDTPMNKVHKGEYELDIKILDSSVENNLSNKELKEFQKLSEKISGLEKQCEGFINENYDKVFNKEFLEILGEYNKINKSEVPYKNIKEINN